MRPEYTCNPCNTMYTQDSYAPVIKVWHYHRSLATIDKIRRRVICMPCPRPMQLLQALHGDSSSPPCLMSYYPKVV